MRRLPILLLLLLLVSCKSSLFENIDEEQANRIIAVLSEHGIAGFKERNDDKTWNVTVDTGNMVAATDITREYALPRGGHTNLGELFSRQGLISNPGEDRVRYVYGMTQELSETLEKIDGVLVARVHIVEPQRDPLMRQVTPPSASVMLRYRSDYNIEGMREKILGLVAGSVEGLTPERVSLTFIPVSPYVDTGASGGAGTASAAGGACAARSPGPLHGNSLLVTILLACMAFSLFVSALIWGSGIRSFSPTFFRRRRKRAAPGAGRETGRNAADGKDKP